MKTDWTTFLNCLGIALIIIAIGGCDALCNGKELFHIQCRQAP